MLEEGLVPQNITATWLLLVSFLPPEQPLFDMAPVFGYVSNSIAILGGLMPNPSSVLASGNVDAAVVLPGPP